MCHKNFLLFASRQAALATQSEEETERGGMASGRARLPPTPQAGGNGSGNGTGSSSRPLAEMHTNNNTYALGAVGDKTTTGSMQDMAASHMLDNLTDQERQIILNVLNRDENVRQADAARIM